MLMATAMVVRADMGKGRQGRKGEGTRAVARVVMVARVKVIVRAVRARSGQG